MLLCQLRTAKKLIDQTIQTVTNRYIIVFSCFSIYAADQCIYLLSSSIIEWRLFRDRGSVRNEERTKWCDSNTFRLATQSNQFIRFPLSCS